MNTKLLGNKGEQIATDYLFGKGYKILHRNFVAFGAEIDIVAMDESTDSIVFVEVKTLSNSYFEQPYEKVNFKKQKRIIKAANSYLVRHNIDKEARFDVVSIVANNTTPLQIEHIISAFNPFDLL
ncbi:MAG: YraN family protein [Bacteroidales bacterium]|nr:YraN family protein [Bacteroidales bacterium]MDY5737685.1 YraN family protein [Candidatus Onthomorpha sp.]